MSECKICRDPKPGMRMMCSLGSICSKCSHDIHIAEMQSLSNHHTTIWVLAETFFRRGKGEDIDFKTVWSKMPYNGRLITMEDIIPLEVLKKAEDKNDQHKGRN